MSNKRDNVPYYPFIHLLIFFITVDDTLCPYYFKNFRNEIQDLKYQ